MAPKNKQKQPNLREIVDDFKTNLENKLGKIDDKLTIVANDLTHIKNNIITKLLDENAILRSKLCKMEIDMQMNFQKQRENNIVLSGIPVEISDDALENTVVSIAQSLNCPIDNDDIQACHRLPSKNVH